jgi:uncharacterized protein YegP (UPF0339 family)
MKIKVYVDVRGQWRWSCVAPNGRIVADSAEAYVSHRNVVRAAKAFLADAAGMTLDDG